MNTNKAYLKKLLQDPLPRLAEDERIYLNVPFNRRQFAKISNCGFDSERKLWFTGIYNRNLDSLIELYGINEEATSETAIQMVKDKT